MTMVQRFIVVVVVGTAYMRGQMPQKDEP